MSPDSNDEKKMPVKPAAPVLSGEERSQILAAALKNMVMIDGKVYGLEDDTEPEAFVDCASKTALCRAECCKYVFALTRAEVSSGIYKYNPERPFYLARDADGYCPYLDRATFKGEIHAQRPVRCRKYACPWSSRT